MSWFDTTSFSKYAKSALKNAQKNIDKVLDIKDEDDTSVNDKQRQQVSKNSSAKDSSLNEKNDDVFSQTDSFFDSFLGNEKSKKKSNEKKLDMKNSTSKSPVKLKKVDKEKKFDKGRQKTDEPTSDIKNFKETKESKDDLEGDPTLFTPNQNILEKPSQNTITSSSSNLDHEMQQETPLIIDDNSQLNNEEKFDTFFNESVISDDNNTLENTFESSFHTPIKLIDKSIGEDGRESVSLVVHDSHDTTAIESEADETNIDSSLQSFETVNENAAEISRENIPVISESSPENISVISECSPEKISVIATDKENTNDIVEDVNNTENELVVSNSNIEINDTENVDTQVGESETDVYETEDITEHRKSEENFVDSVIVDDGVNLLQNESIDKVDNSIPVSDALNDSNDIRFTPVQVEVKQQEDCEQSEEVKSLEKKIVEMRDILDAREKKLFELSKENIELNEAVSIYRGQLEQLEKVNANENKETENMQEEFSVRVGEYERKLKETIRERDRYKQCFEELQETMNTSVSEKIKSLTESLIERDETITNLMQEGDSLSKKELEANNRIKKLRIKLKELTNETKSSQEKITKLNSEIESLQLKLSEKNENESRLHGEVTKLEKLTDLQEDEITSLKDKIDDLEEKYKPIETSLETCYGEINKLNLEKAQVDSLLQEKTCLLEKNEELNEKLKQLEKKSKYGNEELNVQLENLQQTFTRSVQKATRREELLKNEIKDLQQRLEEGEQRNQELSQSVTTATRPLLRQIENLQSSHTNQARNWERIEKNLTDRLADLQHQLDLAVEKEHSATQYANEVKSKFKVLEKQNRELKDSKLKLELTIESERSQNIDETKNLEKEKKILEKRFDKMKDMFESLETEKKFLEEQMTTDKIRFESDLSRLNNSIMAQQQTSLQRMNSVSSVDAPSTPTSRHSPRFSTPDLTASMSDSLSVDGRLTATTVSMELLESQLRKRDGEVYVLKEEVKSLEKTKASLARELVTLTNQIEELETSKEHLSRLKDQHADLQSRYNAVLQMYGEKAEEAEELKMDLVDVKAMYKQQIEQLLGDR